jgi:hypothetical protein
LEIINGRLPTGSACGHDGNVLRSLTCEEDMGDRGVQQQHEVEHGWNQPAIIEKNGGG